VGQARGLRAEAAQSQAALLSHAVSHNPRLRELAARPILLTLMASLHAWCSGSLLEKREEFYADAVELLLDQWESSKVMRRPDGTYQVIEPSLAEWLRIDRSAICRVLNQLAFEAHERQESLVGTADISQRMLVNALLEVQQNPDVNLRLLLVHLRDRAGILEPRGVGVYAFPHRTFQEYLATCHLTDDPAFPDSPADLVRKQPNRWREVALLAGAKAKRGAAISVWNVAEALCYEAAPATKQTDAGGYWGGLIGAQMLLETESLDRVAERNRPKVERLRNWLVRTLEHSALAPVDRVQAGDALARLGDPRFLAERWYLPDEPLLGFVEIPAGRFVMGSEPEKDADAGEAEQPQHEVVLPGYFIGRYPVTVAQFRVFVEESGYEPSDVDCLRGIANHPVVWVNWHDALEYCKWLTVQLQSWKHTPLALARLLQHGGCVTLPSEAQWEKAARGTDGCIYPWGDGWDSERVNTGETGIG
jgi:hypothetical protein